MLIWAQFDQKLLRRNCGLKYQSLDICAYRKILPTDVYFISEQCNLPWIASNYGGTEVFYNTAFLDWLAEWIIIPLNVLSDVLESAKITIVPSLFVKIEGK